MAFFWTAFLALQLLYPCLAMPSATVQVLGPTTGSKKTTEADLVKAVTTTCSLVLTSDVVLTANLPPPRFSVCREIRIVGRCRGRKFCKIDGANKYRFIAGGTFLYLENLEITRMRSDDPASAPVVSGSSGTIRRCRITKNVNPANDGVVRGSLTIENTVFEHNQGGVLRLEDERGNFINATNVVFRRNRNFRGGAVSAFESRFFCTRCLFEGNVAEDKGGAVYLSDNDGTESKFTRCRFVGNKVVGTGGQGGAVYTDDTDSGVTFCNCQFQGNLAPDGKVNHVFINGLEQSIIYFCPARPRTGIVITPKDSEEFVKDGCVGCT